MPTNREYYPLAKHHSYANAMNNEVLHMTALETSLS